MIGLQPGHIVIIVLIAILLFVPMRLPQLVRGFKGMFSQFRKEVGGKDHAKSATPEASKNNRS